MKNVQIVNNYGFKHANQHSILLSKLVNIHKFLQISFKTSIFYVSLMAVLTDGLC